MKAAPPIESIKVLDNFVLQIKFEGMPYRYIDLTKFNLLGPIAKKLALDENFLKSFKLVDGVPEWNGMCLLGPEDLLEQSKEKLQDINNFKATGALFRALKKILKI